MGDDGEDNDFEGPVIAPEQIRFGVLNHHFTLLDTPRPLTAWEKAVLSRVTSQPFEGRDAVEAQIPHARVDQVCSHCPSVGLAADGRSSLRAPELFPGTRDHFGPAAAASDSEAVSRALMHGEPSGGALPCELAGWDEDGVPFQILVLVWDGYIYKIDAFRGDSESFKSLPSPRDMWLVSEIPRELLPR